MQPYFKMKFLLVAIFTIHLASASIPNITFSTDKGYSFGTFIKNNCTLGKFDVKPFSANVLFYMNTTTSEGQQVAHIPLGSFDTFSQNDNTTFESAGDAAKPYGDFFPAGHNAFKSYYLEMKINNQNFSGTFGCKLTWNEQSGDGYANMVSTSKLSNVWVASGVWQMLPSLILLLFCVFLSIFS